MTAKEKFALRLKELRGDMPVKNLAETSGMTPTAIYKAEDGKEPVRWKTVETVYGPLCTNHGEYENLLMLWAITQSERPVALYTAKEAMKNVISEEAAAKTKETSSVLREMELMDANAQRKFSRLAHYFRTNESTRKLAEIWMEVIPKS